MEQQTAVEFLIESIDARGLWTKELRKEAEQAKQMEKVQSKRDYYAGLEGYIVKDGGFEQYYNETYGK